MCNLLQVIHTQYLLVIIALQAAFSNLLTCMVVVCATLMLASGLGHMGKVTEINDARS